MLYLAAPGDFRERRGLQAEEKVHLGELFSDGGDGRRPFS